MAYEHKIQRHVEFSETDMAGIMHFSNFFRFMETAEHSFYRSLGFSVVLDQYDPPLGFPRVHVNCDFKRPVKFEDLVEVQLLVKEKRRKTLSYQFRFRNLSAPEHSLIAIGHVTIVCVTHQPDKTITSAPIPEEIASRIDVAPKELIDARPA